VDSEWYRDDGAPKCPVTILNEARQMLGCDVILFYLIAASNIVLTCSKSAAVAEETTASLSPSLSLVSSLDNAVEWARVSKYDLAVVGLLVSWSETPHFW